MTAAAPRVHNNLGLKVFSCVVLALILLGVSIHFWNRRPPGNLGPQLEYVGKQNYGCWLLCDSSPSSTYYFATDMTPEELLSYFENAKCVNAVGGVDSADYTGRFIDCSNQKGSFTITYYDPEDTVHIAEMFKLKATGKQVILSMDRTNYKQAKTSL